MASFQPFDALTVTLPAAADFGVPARVDAVLQALDDLTGGAAQYPFVPRPSGPETVRFAAADTLAVRGDEGALFQALVVAWFAGTAVTVHSDRPERWDRLAEAGRALAVPGLEVRSPDEAGPGVLTLEAPLRWEDLGFAPWARALLRAEVVAGGHQAHRAPFAEESVAARFRFLVEQVRRDPGFRPVPPAEGMDFPVQSKADLEAMTVAGGYDGQVLRSGASTGQPRYIAYSRGDWQRMVAEAVPVLYAVGLQPGDRVVNTLFGGSLYGGLTTSLCELSRMSVLNFTTGQHVTPAELVDLWRRFEVNALVGMPTLLLPLLRDAAALEPELRISTIVFGGSPLAEHDRDWLADHLGTRTVSSILAANDGAQIAYQCPHQRGRTHHLVDDYNLVEVVDDEDRPVPDGVPGHILLTTLQKLHQPLVRYRIGDLGALGRTACACGVNGRTLEYLGRADGVVKVKARTFAHAEVLDELQPFGVSELQVVVDTVDGTESVLVRAESAAGVAPEQLRKHLSTRFEAFAERDHFGEGRDVFRFAVEVLAPGTLERNPVSGKVRPVLDSRVAVGRRGPALRLPEPVAERLTAAGGAYLRSPYVLPAAEVEALGADLLRVAGLLRDLPRRLGHDAAGYAAELGYPAAIQALLAAAEGLPDPLFGRVDALRTAEGFAVVEYNATSETGGLEWVDPAGAAWWEEPATADALDRAGLRRVSPIAGLAAELRAFARRTTGVGEPRVAIVGGPVGLAEHGPAWHPLRDQLTAAGASAVVTDVFGLEVTPSGVRHAGERIDVVYRIFALEQVAADPRALTVLHALVEAAQAGRVGIFTSLASELARDKRGLALLSSADPRLALDEDERTAVARVVPPTEVVAESDRERLLADRATLIYKPARGYGGEGVVAGWEVGADRWAEHLASGVPAVVQQRAVPLAEEAVHAGGTPWVGEAVLGIYYLPEAGFAGGGARLHAFGEPFVTESGQAPPSQLAAILLSDGRRLDGPAS